MNLNFSKIDWWKANSYWGFLTIAVVWITALSVTTNVLFIGPLFFASILPLLISIGLYKKSTLVFYIALVSNLFSLYRKIPILTKGGLEFSLIDITSYISYILFFCLTWNFFRNKK